MRLSKIGRVLILLLLWAGAPCHARQETADELENEDPEALRVERLKRLAISGRVVSEVIELPVPPTGGEITPRPALVDATGPAGQVRAMRLHFAVRQLDESQRGTWSVTVMAGRRTWKYASDKEPESTDFWTPVIPGRLFQVRVFSTVPRSTLQLVIDERIEYEEPKREKTIVEPKDDRVGMDKVSSPDQRLWARAVALLTFKGRMDGKPYTCTGFLVSPRHLITNDHCPRSRSEISSTIVEFDYDEEYADTDRYQLTLEPLPRDKKLDFAIYKLNREATGRGYLRLKNDDENIVGLKPLVIFQHPGGLPKLLAEYDCKVLTARHPVAPPTDFAHKCDTEGGSSGSPVQNTRGEVIGLHHFGYGKFDTQKINQAVKMGEILKYLSRDPNHRDLYRQLCTGNDC
jgi:V8-like Glu-specific endopeptidase